MKEERFSVGGSPLHRGSVKLKLCGGLLFIPAFAITPSYREALIFLFISLLLTAIARLPLKHVINRLVLANFFSLFLFITLPLTYGGDPFLIWGVPVSKAGFLLGGLIVIKTNGILLALIALLGTSTVSSLGHGLNALGVSDRLTALLLFSYRYIFVIEQEFKRLQRAAKIRGFSPGTNVHTYRTFGYLIGMTMVKSWDQSQRIHDAMVLRGYDGQFFPLTNPSNRSPFDLILFLGLVLASIILTFLGYLG
ncbi:MAG: cobalt ECF transporter T component CbiQ [Desulfobulbaceae bacterium]|nr:MAG: cobalt ECF transporter T component CbiQ [Desulfobulbaceae bacterium]